MDSASVPPSPRPLPPTEEEVASKIRTTLVDLDSNTKAFIRRNPTVCVVGAVAIGFLFGRLVTR